MEHQKYSIGQKLKFTFTILTFFMLVLWGVAEIGVRILKPSSEYKDKAIKDKVFGWSPTAHLDVTYPMSKMGEEEPSYEVNYTTDHFGFRILGDTTSSKPKVLFLGDSYVQCAEVSTDKTFYKILRDSMDIEVFAYGMAGYGTLQEKLVLDIYRDIIRPDLIILQTCDNDFIDNCADLEYNSLYKVGLTRPYLKGNGKVKSHLPQPVWQRWSDKSAFLKLVRRKLQNSLFKSSVLPTEKQISSQHVAYQPYADCLDITLDILKLFKESADSIPVLGFSASYYEPQLSDFSLLFKKADIPFHSQPILQLKTFKEEGHNVHSYDGFHWNELGQEKMAEYLRPIIEEQLTEL